MGCVFSNLLWRVPFWSYLTPHLCKTQSEIGECTVLFKNNCIVLYLLLKITLPSLKVFREAFVVLTRIAFCSVFFFLWPYNHFSYLINKMFFITESSPLLSPIDDKMFCKTIFSPTSLICLYSAAPILMRNDKFYTHLPLKGFSIHAWSWYSH